MSAHRPTLRKMAKSYRHPKSVQIYFVAPRSKGPMMRVGVVMGERRGVHVGTTARVVRGVLVTGGCCLGRV